MSHPIFHKPLRLAAALVASGLLSWHGAASTQTIDRMKLSDGDLSCQQIFGEIRQMEGIAAVGGAVVAQVAPQAAMQAPVPAAAPANNMGSNLLGGLLGAAQARGNVGGGNSAMAGLFGNLAAGLNGGAGIGQAQLNQASAQGLGLLGQLQSNPEFQREMAGALGQAGGIAQQMAGDPNNIRQLLLQNPDAARNAVRVLLGNTDQFLTKIRGPG